MKCRTFLFVVPLKLGYTRDDIASLKEERVIL